MMIESGDGEDATPGVRQSPSSELNIFVIGGLGGNSEAKCHFVGPASEQKAPDGKGSTLKRYSPAFSSSLV